MYFAIEYSQAASTGVYFMALKLDGAVPNQLDFETAIALTQQLLDTLEQGSGSEAQIETIVAELVQTETGARGFFVVYLTDDRGFADSPSPAILSGLRQAADTVASLLVKNLVMSTAMEIYHRSHNNAPAAEGSVQVQQRSQRLIRLLGWPELPTHIQAMQQTLATGTGTYQAFLDRQGYDRAQYRAIQEALQLLAD